MKKLLVIARYNENVDWLKTVKIPHLVYNKGLDDLPDWVNQKKLENIGCEEYVYLTHINENYSNLSDTIIFCQADPFLHSPDFLTLLNYTDLFADIQPLTYGYTDYNPEQIYREQTKQLWIKNCKIHVDLYDYRLNRFLYSSNCFNHSPLIEPLKEKLRAFFHTDNFFEAIFEYLNISARLEFGKIPVVPVAYAAMFSVSKDKILSLKQNYYQNLLSLGKQLDSDENNPKALLGWMMEFSWMELFHYEYPFSLPDKNPIIEWWNNV
jgi:hypothetical protein